MNCHSERMLLARGIRSSMLIGCFFASSLCVFAQDPGSPRSVSASISCDTQSNSESQSHEQDKSHKSAKNKKSNEQDGLSASTFSEAVANAVIRRLRDGLEGHSQRVILSIFDPEKMNDYSGFENQIEAFFNHYETFRIHLRMLQTTTDGEKGIVITEVEMEAIPHGDAPPVRKQNQLRFELERSSKGWKIVELNPRDFFS